MSDYVIQSVIFKQSKYTLAEAKKWLTGHNYSSRGVDKTANMLRFRQMTPKKVEKMGFAEYVTKPLGSSGISLIIAYKKKIDGGGIFSDIWKRIKGQHRVAPEPPTAEVSAVPPESLAPVFMVDTSPPSAQNLDFSIPRAEQVMPDRSQVQRAQAPQDKRYKFYKPIIDAHMKNLTKREKQLTGRIAKLQAKLAHNLGLEDALGIEFPREEIKTEIGVIREALADIDWRIGALDRYTFLLDENNAPQDNPQAMDEFYLERDEMLPLEYTYTNVANTLAQRVRDWVNRTPSINPESAFLIGDPSDAARAPPPPPPSGSGITGGTLSDGIMQLYREQFNNRMASIAATKNIPMIDNYKTLLTHRTLDKLSNDFSKAFTEIIEQNKSGGESNKVTIEKLDKLISDTGDENEAIEAKIILIRSKTKEARDRREKKTGKKPPSHPELRMDVEHPSNDSAPKGFLSTTAGIARTNPSKEQFTKYNQRTEASRDATIQNRTERLATGDVENKAPTVDLTKKQLIEKGLVTKEKRAPRRPKDQIERYKTGTAKPSAAKKRVTPPKEIKEKYDKTYRTKKKLEKKKLQPPLPPLPPVDEVQDLFAGEYDPDVEQYLDYSDPNQFDEQGELDQMDFDLQDVGLDEGMTLDEAIAAGANLPPFIPRRNRPPGMRQAGRRSGRGVYLKGHSRISGGMVPVSRSSSPLPPEEPDAPGFPRRITAVQNQMINDFVQQKILDLGAQDTPNNRRLNRELIRAIRKINHMPGNRQTYESGNLVLEYFNDVWGDVPHFSPADYVPTEVGVWRNGALAPYIRTHRSNVVQGDGVGFSRSSKVEPLVDTSGGGDEQIGHNIRAGLYMVYQHSHPDASLDDTRKWIENGVTEKEFKRLADKYRKDTTDAYYNEKYPGAISRMIAKVGDRVQSVKTAVDDYRHRRRNEQTAEILGNLTKNLGMGYTENRTGNRPSYVPSSLDNISP
jgi:hypothetical protein